MIRVRDRLYQKMKTEPTVETIQTYKKVRNMVVSMTRNAKRTYEKNRQNMMVISQHNQCFPRSIVLIYLNNNKVSSLYILQQLIIIIFSTLIFVLFFSQSYIYIFNIDDNQKYRVPAPFFLIYIHAFNSILVCLVMLIYQYSVSSIIY